MSLAEDYVKQIHRELRYWAIWTPGVRVELGDCGPVIEYIFQRETNVYKYGIDFEIRPGTATESWAYTTKKAVSWTIQGSADAQAIPEIPAGQAAIGINFSRKNSVVFLVPRATQAAIADVATLKTQLIEKAVDRGDPDFFPTGFAVVTELVTADSVTVLAANAKQGRFVASAAADFNAGLISLADVKLGITERSSTDVAALLLAERKVTPLFRGFMLKRNWWGKVNAGGLEAAGTGGDDDPFVDLDPDRLAD